MIEPPEKELGIQCIRAALDKIVGLGKEGFFLCLSRSGKGNAPHSGIKSGANAEDRIFEDQDMGRVGFHPAGGLEKDVGGRFAPLNLGGGYEEGEKSAGAETLENFRADGRVRPRGHCHGQGWQEQR